MLSPVDWRLGGGVTLAGDGLGTDDDFFVEAAVSFLEMDDTFLPLADSLILSLLPFEA